MYGVQDVQVSEDYLRECLGGEGPPREASEELRFWKEYVFFCRSLKMFFHFFFGGGRGWGKLLLKVGGGAGFFLGLRLS